MPIFEYRCADCDHAFETLIRNAAEEKSTCCFRCGSHKISKQFSSFGVAAGGTWGSSEQKAPAAPCKPHGCECF